MLVACGRRSSSSGPYGTRGELIPREKSSSYIPERPYGMVLIPGGSFVLGQADYDYTGTPERAPLRTVTVAPFFMDEAEVTNAEYRVFINYVRDSIVRTMLAERAGDEVDEGRGTIGDYAYLDITEEERNPEEMNAYERYIESLGGRDGRPEVDTKKLNWRIPLYWNTRDYPDEAYAEVLESMYIPPAQRINNERLLDTKKLVYTYQYEDTYQAALDQTRNASYFKKKSVAIYPDTLVWVKDFKYANTEPIFTQYFHHKAFSNYPVVGVTWEQANAFTNFKTQLKSEYNESLRKKKQKPMPFRLPTEAEWEYAAKGGRQNASYPWGGPSMMDDRGCYLANFKPKRGNYMEDEKTGNYVYTAPVKKFPKNGYGLYDMAGNVAEWTDSPYHNASYLYTSALNPDLQSRNSNDPRKTVRGGSWKDIGMMLMTSSRDWEHKDSARSYIGFRTAQGIPAGATPKVKRRTK